MSRSRYLGPAVGWALILALALPVGALAMAGCLAGSGCPMSEASPPPCHGTAVSDGDCCAGELDAPPPAEAPRLAALAGPWRSGGVALDGPSTGARPLETAPAAPARLALYALHRALLI